MSGKNDMKYILLVILLKMIIMFLRETADFFKTQIMLYRSSDAIYQQIAAFPIFWEN